MANPEVSWVRERGKNWMLKLLELLKETYPGKFDWLELDDPRVVAVCEKIGANLSMLFARFLERAIPALPNPAARADVVLQRLANLLREDAVWWDPEPEDTVPE